MPRLLVKKREEIISEYVARKNKLKIFIGSKKGNDIVIPDKNVSEHHCTIIFANNQYTLKDQNTIMGTQINFRSITEAPFHSGLSTERMFPLRSAPINAKQHINCRD